MSRAAKAALEKRIRHAVRMTGSHIPSDVAAAVASELLAAFPQLALEGREEWEYAQAIPEWNERDNTIEDWWIHKSFGDDPNRAVDEGYRLVRRALGPWSEVQS